jgi:copper chaperone CopZ
MDMKKKFKMENLDCAHCAAKMEDGIRKIEGVNEVSISFMTQKMVIDADDEKFEEIMEQAAKACAKVDSDCKIIR